MIEVLTVVRPVLLLLMVAVFVSLLLWAYSPRRRERMADCARIPLRDDRL